MNRTALLKLLEELKTAQINREISDGSQLNFEMLDEVILHIEERLKILKQQIDAELNGRQIQTRSSNAR